MPKYNMNKDEFIAYLNEHSDNLDELPNEQDLIAYCGISRASMYRYIKDSPYCIKRNHIIRKSIYELSLHEKMDKILDAIAPKDPSPQELIEQAFKDNPDSYIDLNSFNSKFNAHQISELLNYLSKLKDKKEVTIIMAGTSPSKVKRIIKKYF